VSSDFRAPSTLDNTFYKRTRSISTRFSGAIHIGNLKRPGIIHQLYPWTPTVLSQRPCGIDNNSVIFSKFQKSSRENAQGVEIFLTEPLFTALLKNPLARGRGALYFVFQLNTQHTNGANGNIINTGPGLSWSRGLASSPIRRRDFIQSKSSKQGR